MGDVIRFKKLHCKTNTRVRPFAKAVFTNGKSYMKNNLT